MGLGTAERERVISQLSKLNKWEPTPASAAELLYDAGQVTYTKLCTGGC